MSNKLALDVDDIVNRYQSGESEKRIADSLGVARGAIRARLLDRGVSPRGRSEAESIKWAALKKDRAAVERQCGAAWKAATGKEKSADTMAKLARTRYERLRFVHRGEKEIATALRIRGAAVTQQLAVERYNLDISIDGACVAVEIIGSPWRGATQVTHQRERLERLFDLGWSVLFVVAYDRQSGIIRVKDNRHRYIRPIRIKPVFDASRVAQECIAFAERVRRDESMRRRYGMISGYGEPIPSPGHHLDDFPRVEGF